MDKITKGIWLFDDGKKYYYNCAEGGFLEFEYGYLLMKSSLIMKNHNMSALYKAYNKSEDHKREITDIITLVNYILKSGVHLDIWEIVSEEERAIFVKVVASELLRIKHKDRNELSQLIFNDKELPNDLEKILLGEEVGEDRISDILMLDKLEYVSTVQDGEYLQGYNIVSMGQLIALEVLNVLRHRSEEICYRRCTECKKVFMASKGAGRPQERCRYQYSSGLCAKKRQKKLDAAKDNYAKQDSKIIENIRGMIRTHGVRYSKLHDLYTEYEKEANRLKEQGVSASEYVTLTDKWYEEIDRPWKKKKKAK